MNVLKRQKRLFADKQVLILQHALTSTFYYRAKIDGKFGPITEAAVSRFQNDNGLPITGILDAATWAAIAEADKLNAVTRMVWFEARGESRDGIVAVVNVMMNRALSGNEWPNTLQEVIAQPHQFTPYNEGRYWKRDITKGVPSYFNEAIAAALNGENEVTDNAGVKFSLKDYFFYSVGKPKRYGKNFHKVDGQWFAQKK